jgi:hypothetical protein
LGGVTGALTGDAFRAFTGDVAGVETGAVIGVAIGDNTGETSGTSTGKAMGTNGEALRRRVGLLDDVINGTELGVRVGSTSK